MRDLPPRSDFENVFGPAGRDVERGQSRHKRFARWELGYVQEANERLWALLPRQYQDAMRVVSGELATVSRENTRQVREHTEDILALTLQAGAAHFQRQAHHAAASPRDRHARLEWLWELQACQEMLMTALESLAYK